MTGLNTAVHLDAAGAPPPNLDMIREICDEMMKANLGNPHSKGSAVGQASNSRTVEARKLVLEHFGADESEYDIVFTSGTTSSMNLVGQSFPWSCASHICYPMNAHTSLLGLRTYCSNASSFSSYVIQDYNYPNKMGDETHPANKDVSNTLNLLLVPGECNFSGAKTNLTQVSDISQYCGDSLLRKLNAKPIGGNKYADCSGSWLWLLDAAKLAATSKINLSTLHSKCRPHFVVMSFYKIFGYPTGLGALLIRRDVAPLLSKRYVWSPLCVSIE